MLRYWTGTIVLFCSSLSIFAQTKAAPPIVDFETLEKLLQQENDTTSVFIFWATWCIPCIKELPFFEALNTEMATQPVKIWLVSLDFRNQVNQKLVPFLRKHHIQTQVIVLYEPDANKWIDKVHPAWSGAIPATLIQRNQNISFIEKQFETYEELRQIVETFVKS